MTDVSTLDLLKRLEDVGSITATSLDLTDEKLSFERWESIGRMFARVRSSTGWWIARTLVDGDCLVWKGAKSSDGYGSIRRRGKTVGAHRLAWEECFGEIGSALSVLHSCDNRACVNPLHLFLGTQRDNVLDCLAKGRHRNNRRRERCRKGHLVEGENAYEYRGYKQCCICRAEVRAKKRTKL